MIGRRTDNFIVCFILFIYLFVRFICRLSNCGAILVVIVRITLKYYCPSEDLNQNSIISEEDGQLKKKLGSINKINLIPDDSCISGLLCNHSAHLSMDRILLLVSQWQTHFTSPTINNLVQGCQTKGSWAGSNSWGT